MLNESWTQYLPSDAVEKGLALEARAKAQADAGVRICPPVGNIFRALNLTPPENVRAVILGQDPYHTPGVATGLAFSISPGQKLVPSVRNILKEMSEDTGNPMPASGDLTPWAERGVLLLNTVLTVNEGEPTSHYNWGWETFVREVLQCCSTLPQPVVFLLWGANARKTAEGVCPGEIENKVAFISSHPSPLGAYKRTKDAPAFLGSRPFTKTNQFLSAHGGEPIDWKI